VDSATLPQCIAEASVKSLPPTESVNIGLPATTLPGVSDEMEGRGFAGLPATSLMLPQPLSSARATMPALENRKKLKIDVTETGSFQNGIRFLT
jgi:hypothetical protein